MSVVMGAAHTDAMSWLADNWITVLVLIWVFGGFGALGEWWRRTLAARREAAEIRHQRAVELELARRGSPYVQPGLTPGKQKLLAERWTEAVASGRPPLVMPAAVIASPPGAEPLHGVPGACRHERIVPVIDSTGELHKWACANYPRCDAEFDKSVAIYEPAEGEL